MGVQRGAVMGGLRRLLLFTDSSNILILPPAARWLVPAGKGGFLTLFDPLAPSILSNSS